MIKTQLVLQRILILISDYIHDYRNQFSHMFWFVYEDLKNILMVNIFNKFNTVTKSTVVSFKC